MKYLNDIITEGAAVVVTTSKPVPSRIAEQLVEEMIEKYCYNNVVDRMVALDRSLGILDLRKISHFLTLLLFL